MLEIDIQSVAIGMFLMALLFVAYMLGKRQSDKEQLEKKVKGMVRFGIRR